jgi:phenylalanyl-tRNA synthetase beta chain
MMTETIQVQMHPRGSVRVIALDAPIWAAPAFGVEVTVGEFVSEASAAPRHHDYASSPETASPHFVHVMPLPTTPAAEFDLALVVSNGTTAFEVENLIRAESGYMLERLELFDEFRGAGIPEGSRSLAWRLTFRHPERTLRDKEIDGRRSQLLKALQRDLNVVPRTA